MEGLGKKPLGLSDEQIDDFATIMATPDRGGLMLADICKRFGIASKTVYLYTHRPEVIKLIKSKRAEVIRLELSAIDKAMIKKASAGDVKAAELIYSRWDDYIRLNRSENINIDANSADQEKARKEKVKQFMSEVLEGKPGSIETISAPVDDSKIVAGAESVTPDSASIEDKKV